MEFDGRSGVRCPPKRAAFLRRAEAQHRLLVILHSANLAPHQHGKQRIDEFEDAFATAEILDKRDDLALPAAPAFDIPLEDVRVGQPKPVNALLDVPDQKQYLRAARLSASMILS